MVVRHLQNMINFDLLKEYDSILKDTLKVWQKEKTYSLNEVVQYKGNYLKCTTAGKSGTMLDFTDKDIGDTITDGTAAWEMVEPPSGGGGIAEYNTGKSYYSGDLVIKDNVLYKANTTTSTAWVDSEWDLIGTTLNTISTYAQKIVTNVVAPYEMLMQVGDSNYCKPPIDVLKKTGGSDNATLTLENYNNTSAYTGTGNFLKIENSKAKLYNYKEYPITTQTLSTVDIGVSDEIDFSEFVVSDSELPDFNTLALLHFDTDAVTDATGRIWSINGELSIDKKVSKFGDGSVYLNATGDLSSDYDSVFDFGTGDFTVDFWWKQPTSGDIYSGGDSGLIFGVETSGGMFLCVYANTITFVKAYQGIQLQMHTNIRKTDGEFHHYAIVRSSGTVHLFIDGVLVESIVHTTSYSLVNLSPHIFGVSSSYRILGNIDEFRISNIARWTSNFTPSTPNYNIFSLEVN